MSVVPLHKPSTIHLPKLVDVCPGFKEKIETIMKLAESDPVGAEAAFRDACALAQAFRAGVEIMGGDRR